MRRKPRVGNPMQSKSGVRFAKSLDLPTADLLLSFSSNVACVDRRLGLIATFLDLFWKLHSSLDARHRPSDLTRDMCFDIHAHPLTR
jgi:hypothetical protein